MEKSTIYGISLLLGGLIFGIGKYKDLHKEVFSHKEEKMINYNDSSINAAQPAFNGNVSNGTQGVQNNVGAPTNQNVNGGLYVNPQNQGRSRVEISFDIQKQVDLINSSQNDLQMMENDGNYILADEMRNNISEEEDLLNRLKEEYNEATH